MICILLITTSIVVKYVQDRKMLRLHVRNTRGRVVRLISITIMENKSARPGFRRIKYL